MEALLTVVIVHYNDTPFIKMSLYALSKLTKNKFKIIICDNGSRKRNKRQIVRLAQKYNNVRVIFRKQTTKSSLGHGEALNILISQIDTPYGVILDSDAIFLKKNWDSILINELTDKIKIIGAPIIKGTIKPTDFPLTFAVLFDAPVFKSLKIDLRPKNIRIGQDVGYDMRGKFFNNGYKCKVFEARSTRIYKNGAFRNIICGEYYFKGLLFACHFGRGASLGIEKYKELGHFKKIPLINIVMFLLAKMKGYRQRSKWLAVCKKLIDISI